MYNVYTNNSNFSTWDSLLAVAVASNIIILQRVYRILCGLLSSLICRKVSCSIIICMSELSLCHALQHEKHHRRGSTMNFQMQDAKIKHISMQLQHFVTCTVYIAIYKYILLHYAIHIATVSMRVASRQIFIAQHNTMKTNTRPALQPQ